MKNISTWWYIF